MNNIGRVIRDFNCDGYAGRRYGLENSRIEGEGYDWIVIRITDGSVEIMSFDHPGEKQMLIDKWCQNESTDKD